MASETTAAATGAVGELSRDPFAMLPFCGYNMADYWAHWLSLADRMEPGKLPRIFYVNWFRKSPDGRFLWPGFGDNSRVLEWVFERCGGRGEVVETPIGRLPAPGTIDIEGLDISAEDMDRAAPRRPRRVAGRGSPDRGVLRPIRRSAAIGHDRPDRGAPPPPRLTGHRRGPFTCPRRRLSPGWVAPRRSPWSNRLVRAPRSRRQAGSGIPPRRPSYRFRRRQHPNVGAPRLVRDGVDLDLEAFAVGRGRQNERSAMLTDVYEHSPAGFGRPGRLPGRRGMRVGPSVPMGSRMRPHLGCSRSAQDGHLSRPWGGSARPGCRSHPTGHRGTGSCRGS